jgi:phospholipid/cholesterol/gamma-HCH transport system ATP-binding protein
VSATPIIRYADVYKSFGDHPVLRGVSLTVFPGTVHFVIGASGVGKSVAIKQLVGLLRPDSGLVEFDGTDLSSLDERGFFAVRKRCQMIFQHSTLFDAMTVLENVSMPVQKRFHLSRAKAEQRARGALSLVHAGDLSDRMPSTLGKGVRKRVAIARALVLEPEVLLYDEPTTGLDPVSARRIDRLIREMAHELDLTSVVVSHDLASVRDIGDWVTFLHEGRVCFDGPPDDLFASSDPNVRGFVHGSGSRWAPM